MDKSRVLVVATRNRGKLAEIKNMLKPGGWTVSGLDDFPSVGEIPEEGSSFEENALAKARTVVRLTGMATIADDSGLEVDALDGRPGIYSARFADNNATDDDNNNKLLDEMRDVPPSGRSARFVCVIAAVTPDGPELAVRGECEGVIIEAPRGKAGFGYDPLFYYHPTGKTFAEMTPEEKNLVSHRSRALYKLKEVLPKLLKKRTGTKGGNDESK